MDLHHHAGAVQPVLKCRDDLFHVLPRLGQKNSFACLVKRSGELAEMYPASATKMPARSLLNGITISLSPMFPVAKRTLKSCLFKSETMCIFSPKKTPLELRPKLLKPFMILWAWAFLNKQTGMSVESMCLTGWEWRRLI